MEDLRSGLEDFGCKLKDETILMKRKLIWTVFDVDCNVAKLSISETLNACITITLFCM